jgi:hypothetical protein
MVQFELMNITEQKYNRLTIYPPNHLVFDHQEAIQVNNEKNRKANRRIFLFKTYFDLIEKLTSVVLILIVDHAACLAYSKFDNLSCPVRVISKCFNSIAQ